MSPVAAASHQVNVAAGISAAGAFNPVAYSDWGVVNVTVGSAAGTHQLGWSSERTFDVTAGVAYTIGLYGRHESGNTTNDCTGSFTVQLYPGALP